MVDVNDKPAGSGVSPLKRELTIDDLGVRAWLTQSLITRNDAVLREQLPSELQALVMLFKA